jgi:hypothetical protein
MNPDYATLENLDAWVAEAEKNLIALAKALGEIKRVRLAQKNGVKEKVIGAEKERTKQFQQAYSNISRH